MKAKTRAKEKTRWEKATRSLQAKTDEIFKNLPDTFTDDLLNLTVCCRYLQSLLRHDRVKRYVQKYHPETLARFGTLLSEFDSQFIILKPRHYAPGYKPGPKKGHRRGDGKGSQPRALKSIHTLAPGTKRRS